MKYLSEVRKEMKRVTWPTMATTSHFTWISITFIIAFGLYFGLTDAVFSSFIDWFVNL